MKNQNTFVEIEYSQKTKDSEEACGDNFKTMKIEDRIITVVSDGLGSGIKASLLANMTTSMALNFFSKNMEIIESSEIIMDSLPVCNQRKISYATFTVVDITKTNKVRIIEMDNPGYIHIRNNISIDHKKEILTSNNWPERKLNVSYFKIKEGDRIVFFTDGISQSGIGHKPYKFGWKREGCLEYILERIEKNPLISSRQLAEQIVYKARSLNHDYKCIDDITCGVIYFRTPRKLRLLTGPPFKANKDKEFATFFNHFDGIKIICGGTTAQIIGRELGKKIKTTLTFKNKNLPPPSEMTGIDLVTEGILTLTETAKTLEEIDTKSQKASTVQKIIDYFIESDVIEFFVGTKVNEAHQDPNLPIDLEIRRNIVKRLKEILETKYLKKVFIKYI